MREVCPAAAPVASRVSHLISHHMRQLIKNFSRYRWFCQRHALTVPDHFQTKNTISDNPTYRFSSFPFSFQEPDMYIELQFILWKERTSDRNLKIRLTVFNSR